MKRFLFLAILISFLSQNVYATEIVAPDAPKNIQQYMPAKQSSFGTDLWYIIKNAVADIFPSIQSAVKISLSVIAIVLVTVVVGNISSLSGKAVELAGAVSIGTILLSSANAMVSLAVTTIESISQYGKLLIPVMTTALAAEGGITTSTALYTGTILFDTVLMMTINKIIIPVLYGYLAISVALSATGITMLKQFKSFFKWLMTWTLKIGIYIFTGYLGVTKVISGTTDAAALKATKLALSGTVPVVGGIISDASEAILVSTGVMKNAAGIYGILAMICICVIPFLTIGIQYLLLKITAGICSMFHSGKHIALISDFTFGLGILLATTGTICILFLISIVCFMKGVS